MVKKFGGKYFEAYEKFRKDEIAELKSEIEKFPAEKIPFYYELIEKYKSDKQIVIFKTRAQADEFLSGLDLR